MRAPRSRFRPATRLTSVAAVSAMVVAGASGPVSALAVAPTAVSESSALRVGVLALANTIAAVGQTPELAEPLPFTRTSAAHLLALDDVLSDKLVTALQGTSLKSAMAAVPGVQDVQVADDGAELSFSYSRTVTVDHLELAHDDGTLRFAGSADAGKVTVRLATPDGGTRFVVRVDQDQHDPLLRFALVSKPTLALSVKVATPSLSPFDAREGFTDVDVTGGHYAVDRTDAITLRDPDGRGVLTLEDLRYSTLPDLFGFTRGKDSVDVGFDVALPDSVAVTGGTTGTRLGTLALTQADARAGEAWPTAAEAHRSYGGALAALTGLSQADGLTSLSKYTGAALALQGASDVRFPNLGGGTADLFSPGDELLDLLATAATAQIRCGVSPGNPPSGTPAPGDTVYCEADTPESLGDVTAATWTVNGGNGAIAAATTADDQLAAVGAKPSAVVQVDGSNGEPDLTLHFTADGKDYTARTLPHTVQQVVRRIGSLGDQSGAGATASSATLDLAAKQLDVAVDIRQGSGSADLPLGNPGTLGALVGLTGLKGASGGSATATATATGGRFDVGFGVATGAVAAGDERGTVLLPRDGTLLSIDDVSATTPTGLGDLAARIGFLGVKAAVKRLSLGRSGTGEAVALSRLDGGTGALALSDLLDGNGALEPQSVGLASAVTAGIDFSATEQALSADAGYATTNGPAKGTATVDWDATGIPTVSTDDGYDALRVFDPVPARFLHGTAVVSNGKAGVTVPGGDLYATLGVPAVAGTQVARKMIGPGVGCQNVTLTSATTLTCEGLAPQGTPLVADGQSVDLVVLGDPFALRDGIIEGLSGALNAFDRLDDDHRTGPSAPADDQYTSTLPLVALTPAQLATERASLHTGMANLAADASKDETSGKVTWTPVSSAQEMTRAFADDGFLPGTEQMTMSVTGAAGDRHLSVAVGSSSTSSPVAPLRFQVNGTGQVQSKTDVTVQAASRTDLGIDVNASTARAVVTDKTRTVSSAYAALGADDLRNRKLQAGAGDLVLADAGSSAGLGIRVTTAYDGSELVTTRTVPEDSTLADGKAALAGLKVDDTRTIAYSATAEDSSGGAGADQPAPEKMNVSYLAEGLDGLGAALGDALDGAAPRNADPDSGAPVAAPLIGTNLDGGAKIRGTLTSLTSRLRDGLAGVTATNAEDLRTEVKDAVEGALDATGDTVARSGTAVVTVLCGTSACEDDATDTEWSSVGVTFTAESAAPVVSTTPFDIGLAGVNVTSDWDIPTSTTWQLPVDLRLVRGVGPQVHVDPAEALSLHTTASLPTDQAGCPGSCLKAVMGYLPAKLTPKGGADGGSVAVGVGVTAAAEHDFDLFDLYDGKLSARPSFLSGDDATAAEKAETGIDLAFQTTTNGAGGFDMRGDVKVPWTSSGFGDVTYNDVALNLGAVVGSLGKPFKIVDPYLGPVRDVVNVLRTPIPVVSDLSQLGGGDEISLLSLLAKLTANQPKNSNKRKGLEMATRVISFVSFASDLAHSIAGWSKPSGSDADGYIGLDGLAATGALLTLDPSEVELASSCKQTLSTRKPSTTGGAATTTRKSAPCPEVDDDGQETGGVQDQTTQEKRKGTREALGTKLSETTKGLTGSAPGFSLPFLSDPQQLMDVLTGEGEATYFRIDFGSLVASVSYSQSFGPIMAGPVPISPFVGGSISVEGRLAVGFDSQPLTLATEGLDHPGDVAALETALGKFDGGDIIREGFYLDDLDDEGVDVPEVKLVTTLEAGAGVSIGIVTAGLKGGVTLTINVDLHDPNGDGKLRTAEIRDNFSGNAKCAFEADGDISAFIAVFIEINLLLTTESWDYDILRLGPYPLFHYGCPVENPKLVHWVDGSPGYLQLTSGNASGRRLASASDVSDSYEVRQFDTDGGAAKGGETDFEVAAFNRVQRVHVTPESSGFKVEVLDPAVAVSSTVVETGHVASLSQLRFVADGGNADDILKFLQGEDLVDVDGATTVVTSAFDTAVTADGGLGNDIIVTGDATDTVTGGTGNDSVDTGLGDDVVHGDAGNDVVSAGAGNDDVTGDGDDDRLQGGPGADRVDGGTGKDSVVGGPGRDIRSVLVAVNADVAQSMAREQVLAGFDSGDVLVGGDGTDTVDGADGSDVVVGGPAPSLTSGSLGDRLSTGDRAVLVLVKGRTVPDTVTVSVPTAAVPDPSQLDTLCTSGDLQTGSGGTDFVTGGGENDVVVGSDGADTLDGGGGRDELCGLNGADHLAGDGAALPAKNPADDSDVLRGGLGDDRIEAGSGNDVAFGDDVDLVRDGKRVLEGSLGSGARGAGSDYLDGGDGNDVLSGGAGSDQVLGGAGDDTTSGEGTDTAATDGAAPDLADRLVDCTQTTRVVQGYVDLDGDLLAGTATVAGASPDNGRLAGLVVASGVVQAPGSSTPFTGLVAGDVVVVDGRVDLDHDGSLGAGDTGTVPLASMAATAANADGDCVLAGDGSDRLRGGTGSDYLGGGDGTDLADGGDGNDLVLGDGGTDVLLGGPHHDVLVGGTGDDQLVGGNGDDRLRGNEGDDVLTGGSETSGATDGQDVLLGGRGQDVLAAENARTVSASVVDAVATASWKGVAGAPATVLAGNGSSLRFADSAIVCGSGSQTASRWTTLLTGADQQRDAAQSPGTPLAYDELYGGYDCDWVLGAAGDDVVRGGQDDDVVEGGPGSDLAYGDGGSDVVVGGSSESRTSDAAVVVGRSGAGQTDAGDKVYGDGGPDGEVGDDLLAGDNATPVRRTAGGYDLALADVPVPGTTVPAGVAGADTLYGSDEAEGAGNDLTQTDRDRVYGQSGDDVVRAGRGADYVEGNAGGDALTGGEGEDVLVGGSSLGTTPGTSSVSSTGPLDGVDTLVGDGGVDGLVAADLLLGDNATVTGVTTGAWGVQLATSPTGATSAGDGIWGGGMDGTAGAPGSSPDDDRVFGQGGDDVIWSGTGDDHVEGNQGDDTVDAGTGNDDVVGGSTSAAGQPLATGRLTAVVADLDASAAGVPDGVDTVVGGEGQDVVLGDNGRITRPASAPAGAVLPYRDVAMADTTAGATSGSDRLSGGAGDDVLYGQLDDSTGLGDGDVLRGGDGSDAVLGDLGVVTPTAASTLGRPTTLTSKSGQIQETVYGAGTNVPVTVVDKTVAGLGGSDVAYGDAGDDVLRLGAGNDLATGGDGDDAVLGGLGDDALWGGLGHDRLLGGYGDDDLDLKPRTGDPAVYTTLALRGVADTDNLASTSNGADLAYGGWGIDEMQADQGGAGRQAGSDQLVDWVGNHNLYYVCDGPYGAGRVLRQSSPDVEALLTTLATALGGKDVATSGAGGFWDLGMVTNSGSSANSAPAPGAPGNFTCEGAG